MTLLPFVSFQPQAPKRKFLFNPPAQSEPNSVFKTAKMDDTKPMEAEIVEAPTSQEVPTSSVSNTDLWKMTENDKLPSKENEVPRSGDGADAADESMVEFQMQNPLPTEQPPSERIADGSMPREQYIPLVELMQPPPKPAPQRPPPPVKPRKVNKGRKGKGCYHQLAENLAVELQAINEKLVNQKLRSLEIKEPDELQELPGMGEDSYVFVNQQGDN